MTDYCPMCKQHLSHAQPQYTKPAPFLESLPPDYHKSQLSALGESSRTIPLNEEQTQD